MRTFLPLLLLTGVGCGSEPSSFSYQSTLNRNTRGLVLHTDGSRGHAGMLRSNCPFETEQGSVTGDYDLPEQDEKVVDSGDLIGEQTVLLTLGDQAHLLEKSTGVYSHETLTISGLRDARLMQGGIVALVEAADGCRVEWTDGRSQPSPCGNLDVHPQTGTALVADGTGVTVLDGQDSLGLGLFANKAVVDGASEALYVADGERISALDLDGQLRWEVGLDEGEVLAIAEAGATGAAAVFIGYEDGRGELRYLDGATGALRASVMTPGLADAVTVSADGTTVAMVRPHETHFYRVTREWVD